MIDDETEIFTDLDVLYISVYADTGMYECFYWLFHLCHDHALEVEFGC